MFDKVKGFSKKLTLWERKCGEGNVSCFPQLNTHPATWCKHIIKLSTAFRQYFQDIEEKFKRLVWVRNPFFVSESSNSLPARLQEYLMDLSSDSGLKIAYAEKILTEFRFQLEKEYPGLGKRALIEPLPFVPTFCVR